MEKSKLRKLNLDIIKVCIILAIITLLGLMSFLLPKILSNEAGTERVSSLNLRSNNESDFGTVSLEGGEWISSGPDWYYEVNGERPSLNWAENYTYFLDEDGRMLKDEWIYQSLDSGEIFHSESISLENFNDIDTDRLCYVGQDGRKLRNKNIYFSVFSFDTDGFCSLSPEDVLIFDGLPCGIERLKRYVILGGSIKEYY